MTFDENKRKKAYDALSERYDVGTYDEFSASMGNDTRRRKAYDALSEHYDVGTFDDFSNAVYDSKPVDTKPAGEAVQTQQQAPTTQTTEQSTTEQKQVTPEERDKAMRSWYDALKAFQGDVNWRKDLPDEGSRLQTTQSTKNGKTAVVGVGYQDLVPKKYEDFVKLLDDPANVDKYEAVLDNLEGYLKNQQGFAPSKEGMKLYEDLNAINDAIKSRDLAKMTRDQRKLIVEDPNAVHAALYDPNGKVVGQVTQVPGTTGFWIDDNLNITHRTNFLGASTMADYIYNNYRGDIHDILEKTDGNMESVFDRVFNSTDNTHVNVQKLNYYTDEDLEAMGTLLQDSIVENDPYYTKDLAIAQKTFDDELANRRNQSNDYLAEQFETMNFDTKSALGNVIQAQHEANKKFDPEKNAIDAGANKIMEMYGKWGEQVVTSYMNRYYDYVKQKLVNERYSSNDITYILSGLQDNFLFKALSDYVQTDTQEYFDNLAKATDPHAGTGTNSLRTVLTFASESPLYGLAGRIMGAGVKVIGKGAEALFSTASKAKAISIVEDAVAKGTVQLGERSIEEVADLMLTQAYRVSGLNRWVVNPVLQGVQMSGTFGFADATKAAVEGIANGNNLATKRKLDLPDFVKAMDFSGKDQYANSILYSTGIDFLHGSAMGAAIAPGKVIFGALGFGKGAATKMTYGTASLGTEALSMTSLDSWMSSAEINEQLTQENNKRLNEDIANIYKKYGRTVTYADGSTGVELTEEGKKAMQAIVDRVNKNGGILEYDEKHGYTGQYMTNNESKVWKMENFMGRFFDNLAMVTSFRLQGIGKAAFSRAYTEEDLIAARNKMLRESGKATLSADDEKALRRQFIEHGQFKRYMNVSDIAGNIMNSMAEMSARGAAEKAAAFTKRDRQIIYRLNPDLIPALEALKDRAVAIKEGKAYTGVTEEDQRNTREFLITLNDALKGRDVPKALISKILYNTTGESLALDLVANVERGTTPDGKYVVKAFAADGSLIDEQVYDDVADRERACEEYGLQMDQVRLNSALASIAWNEFQANFQTWYAQDIIRLQAEGKLGLSADQLEDIPQFERALLILNGNAEGDKRKAFEIVRDEYLANRITNTDAIVKEVADSLDISVRELQSALNGHDMNHATEMAGGGRVIAIAPGLFRTEREQAFVDQFRNLITDKDELAKLNSLINSTVDTMVAERNAEAATSAVHTEGVMDFLTDSQGKEGEDPNAVTARKEAAQAISLRAAIEQKVALENLQRMGISPEEALSIRQDPSRSFAERDAANRYLMSTERLETIADSQQKAIDTLMNQERTRIANLENVSVGDDSTGMGYILTAELKGQPGVPAQRVVIKKGDPRVDKVVTVVDENGQQVGGKDNYFDTQINLDTIQQASVEETEADALQKVTALVQERANQLTQGSTIGEGTTLLNAKGEQVTVKGTDPETGKFIVDEAGTEKQYTPEELIKMREDGIRKVINDESAAAEEREKLLQESTERKKELEQQGTTVASGAAPETAGNDAVQQPEISQSEIEDWLRTESGDIDYANMSPDQALRVLLRKRAEARGADFEQLPDAEKLNDIALIAKGSLKSAIDQINKLATSPITANNPDEQLAATQQREQQLASLNAQAELFGKVLDLIGQEQLYNADYTGLVESAAAYRFRMTSPEWADWMDAMTKRLGLKLNLQYLGSRAENGQIRNGVITINMSDKYASGASVDITPDKIRQTVVDYVSSALGHEFTHGLFIKDREAMQSFVDSTKKYLGEEDFNSRVDGLVKDYLIDSKLFSDDNFENVFGVRESDSKKRSEIVNKATQEQIDKAINTFEHGRGYFEEEIACDMAGQILADSGFVKSLLGDVKEAPAETVTETAEDAENEPEQIYTDDELGFEASGFSKVMDWLDKASNAIASFFDRIFNLNSGITSAEVEKDPNRMPGEKSEVDKIQSEREQMLQELRDKYKAIFDKITSDAKKEHADNLKKFDEQPELIKDERDPLFRTAVAKAMELEDLDMTIRQAEIDIEKETDEKFRVHDAERIELLNKRRAKLQDEFDAYVKNNNVDVDSVRLSMENQKNVVSLYRVDYAPVIDAQRENMPEASEWTDGIEKVVTHTSITSRSPYLVELRSKAKAGDVDAARELLIQTVKTDRVQKLAEEHPNAVIVYVHAAEESGRNVLPCEFAHYMSEMTGLPVDETVYQSNRPMHTGSNERGRMIRQTRFEGDIKQGQEYIIVDDQYTVGGTLRNLGDFISAKGGKVVAVSTLTNSTRGPKFAQTKETREALKANGITDATVRALGITSRVSNLTEHEAKVLLKDAKLGLWGNSSGTYRFRADAKDINNNVYNQQNGTSSRNQRQDDRSSEGGILAERGGAGGSFERQAGPELTIEDVLEEILRGTEGEEVRNSIRRPTIDDFESSAQKAADADMLSDISHERYSVRQEKAPKRRKYGYKAFKLKNGKLYPPKVKNPEGVSTELGIFLDADAGTFAGKSSTGRGGVQSTDSGTLSFRPGWHLGYMPFGKQFLMRGKNAGKAQGDIVYALVEFDAGNDYSQECDAYGLSESGKYNHNLAGVPYLPVNGYYEYRTNPDPTTDAWAISGSMRVLNILTRAEEAEILARSGETHPEVHKEKLTDEQVAKFNAEIEANLKGSMSGAEYVRLLDSINEAKKMSFDEMHDYTFEDENGFEGPKYYPELAELDAVRSPEDALRAFRYAQIIQKGGEDAEVLRQQIYDYKQAVMNKEKNAVKTKLGRAHLDWFRQQTGLISDETAQELRDNGLTVSGGVPMDDASLVLKEQTGYTTPEEISDTDLLIRHSYRTKDRWAGAYAGVNPDERQLQIINLVDDWYERAAADDLTHDYMSYADYPSGDINRDGIGPLRKNVEYIFTFDLDTTCPRTFQYLNYADMIEERIGRPLSQREAVILIETMRAMGQQIPCVYCYAENKRQALKQYFLNYISTRKDVISAKTNKQAAKLMYGQDSKGKLSDAAKKVFDAWRSKDVELNNYNPNIDELVADFRFARESIMTLLDYWLESGKINTSMKDKDICDLAYQQYKLTTGKDATYDDKNRAATIGNIVNEWHYDVLEHEKKTGKAANEPVHKNYNKRYHPQVWLTPGAKNALALWNEMTKYGKSASSAHNAVKYYPYTDELSKVTEKDKAYINGMGGLRMHSTNDFRIDYVGDYFQLIADMEKGGWKGHTYTKNPDFVRIFGRTGYRINMSLAGYDVDGKVLENHEEGHFWEEAKELRRLFPNAGTMFMTTSRQQLSYALNADWIDMIIPYHSSGLPEEIISMRAWEDAQSKQNEKFYNSTDKKKKLKEIGITIPKGANAEIIDALYDANFKTTKIYDNTSDMKYELKNAKVKIPNGISYDELKQLYVDTFGHECEAQGERIRPHFLPYDTYVAGNKIPGWSKPRATEAKNTKRYMDLCEEYGVHPRFKGLLCDDADGNEIDITEHPHYMKVLKETARMDTDQEPVKFNLDEPNPDLGINPATGTAYTPLDYAFAKLREFAGIGGYSNLKEDPYGIVESFIKDVYEHEKKTGEKRPLDWISDDARLMWAIQHAASDQASSLPNEDLFRAVPVPYHRFSTRVGDPFYSNAGKAVQDIRQEKATGDQWLAMIQKAGGLKKEEDKWTGLSDWLKGKKGVTKDEVMQYIADNAIQVEEVHYSDSEELRKEGLDRLREEFEQTMQQLRKDATGLPTPDEAKKTWDDFGSEMYDKYGASFSLYLNPEEKQHYIELMKKWQDSRQAYKTDEDLAKEAFSVMAIKYGDDFVDGFHREGVHLFMTSDDETDSVRPSTLRVMGIDIRPINDVRTHYTTTGLNNKREIALTVPNIEPYNQNDQIHFGDAGEGRAVAWLRFGDAETSYYTDEMQSIQDEWQQLKNKTDRTPEENQRMTELSDKAKQLRDQGKTRERVLVIDEIQSKRHQDGREKGYQDDDIARKREELSEQYGQLNSHYYDVASRIEAASNYVVREKLIDKNIDAIRGNITAEQYQELKSIISQLDAIDAERESLSSQGNAVPDAPFRKNWQELAMKRMLRYAAENGYDKVAWTTGIQQAERYGIGKKVEAIASGRNESDERMITLRVKDTPSNVGYILIFDDNGIITKAQEVVSDNKELKYTYPSWMQATIGIHVDAIFGKELGEKLIKSSDREKGYDKFEKEDLYMNIGGMKGFYDKMLPDFMNKYGKKWGVKVQDVTLDLPNEADRVMHSVDVTPEMKESVMEGQPLFSIRAKGQELGAPYSGTKGAIGEELVSVIPGGTRFVDLFSGGGAMTHAALLSGKYDSVHMNDVNPIGQRLFLDGVEGKYADYTARPMDRETFKSIKGTPEGVLYSVGYQNRNWSEKVRPEGRIKRVQRLAMLSPLRDKITSSETDYRNVQIQPGDVLYADIPYYGTDNRAYGAAGKFDYEAFSDWAESLDQPVYVSSVVAPRGFEEIWSGEQSGFRAGQIRQEKLFTQSKFADRERTRIAAMEDNILSQRYSKREDREDSAAFKNWFGNWEEHPEEASKVIDLSTGRPMVLHHATSSYGFTVFDTSADWNRDNVGSHFGPKSVSEDFGPDEQTYNVYLNIRKPWEAWDFFADNYNNAYLDALNGLRKEIGTPEADAMFYGRIKSIYPHLTKEKIQEAVEEGFNEVFSEDEGLEMNWNSGTPEQLRKRLGMLFNKNRFEMVDLLRDMLKLGGYDGIKYQNWYEGDGQSECWIALEPNQIKSADVEGPMANNGDFDPTNSDIRYSQRVGENFASQLREAIGKFDEGEDENGNIYSSEDLLEDIRLLYDDSSAEERDILAPILDRYEQDHEDYLDSGRRDDDGSEAMVERLRDVLSFTDTDSNSRFSQRALETTNRVIEPQPEDPTSLLGEEGKAYNEIYSDKDLINIRRLIDKITKEELKGVIGDASAGAYFKGSGTPDKYLMAYVGDTMSQYLTFYRNLLEDRMYNGPETEARFKVYNDIIQDVNRARQYYQDFANGINRDRDNIRWSQRDEMLNNEGESANNKYKNLSTQDLLVTLQSNKEIDNDAVDEIIRRNSSEEAFLDVGEDLGSTYGPEEEVALAARIIASGIRGDETKPLSEQSAAVAEKIIDYAKSRSLYYSPEEVSRQYPDKLPDGTSASVYVDRETNKVCKLAHIRDIQKEDISIAKFVDELVNFNKVNISLPYNIKGFSRDGEGRFCVVLEQDFVHGKTLDKLAEERGDTIGIWTDSELKKARKSFGYGRKDKKEGGYVWTAGKYEIDDTHGGNIIKTPSGDYYLIDADVTLPGVDGTQLTFKDKVRNSIRTPQFKNWFGDWEKDPENASKVVDKNGEPLVVYHGTMGQPRDMFNIFERGMFASNRDVARYFNGEDLERNGKTYSVYLDIKKPLVVDASFSEWDAIPMEKELAEKLGIESYYRDGNMGKEMFDDAGLILTTTENILNALKENASGYDGVIIKNVYETDYADVLTDDYAVLSSNQIKSATDNNGDFDPNNPDIRYSTRHDVLSDESGEPVKLYHSYYSDGTTDTGMTFLSADKKFSQEFGDKTDEVYARIKRPYYAEDDLIKDAKGNVYRNSNGDEISIGYLDEKPEIVYDLIKRGYDGIVGQDNEFVVVFDPAQMVKADDNPDIRYSNRLGGLDDALDPMDFVARDFKVLSPESLRRELGWKAPDYKGLSHYLRSNGLSITQAAERIYDDMPEAFQQILPNGDADIRDYIIDILSEGGPAKWRKNREADIAEEEREHMEQPREQWFQEAYHMSYNEYLDYLSAVKQRARSLQGTGLHIRQRKGETDEEFETRRNDMLRGRQIAQDAQAAREQVITEIKTILTKEQVDVMSKRELNALMARLNNATPENLIQTVKEVQRTSREIQTRILGIELNNLLSLKTQDRNGKNMSIAKNVSNNARMILDNVRGRMYGLTFTDADQSIRSLRSENYRLREENRRMQFRIDRGDFGTEGDEYNNALQSVLDNETKIQNNNAAIKNLEQARDETVKQQLTIGTGDIEGDINKKLQYMAECAEPGSGKYWSDEDTVDLTTLEVLRSRAEVEQIDQDFREARRQRAAATSARERRAYDDLCEDLERRRLIAVSDTVDKVRNVVEGGKSALQELKAAELQHKQELIHNIMGDIDGGNGKRRGQVEMNGREKESTLKKWATIQLGSFEYMAHRIDINHLSHDGWFYKTFVTGKHGVMQAQNNYLNAYNKSMTELQDKTEEIFGMPLDKVAAKWAKETDEDNPITILLEDPDGKGYRSDFIDLKSGARQPITKAQALYMHMLWKMGDGRAKLEAMGLDDVSMAEINAFIGPKAIEWADWVQEKYLPEIFKRYNAKYTEIYGTPMTENAHYVPIKISKLDIAEQKDLSGDKGKNQTLQIKNGSMINRTANLKPIDLTANAFTVIADHVNEAEEFVAFADVRRDLNTIFNSSAVRNQLNANVAGQYQALYDAAEIATHANVNQATKGLDDMYGKWAKGLIGANIAFRNTTALKQILSVPAFLGYSQDPRYLAALAKNIGLQYLGNTPAAIANMVSLGFTYKPMVNRAAQNKVRTGLTETMRWCMQNMPSFFERVTKGGMGYDILENGNKLGEGKIAKFVNAYLNQGMSTNKLVDAVTCCIGIKTIYDYRMARAKSRLDKFNLSPEDYKKALEEEHRMALMEADIYYNGTQQSNHAAFMAPMQLDKSALSRMMSVYQNASIGFSRKLAENVQNMRKMMTPEGQRRILNGYTKDFMAQGMEEDEARRAAVSKIGGRLLKTAVGVALYGIGTNLIWDLGSRGLIGLFRDDEEKEQTWDWANVLGYPMRGQPLFNMGKSLLDTAVSAFDGKYSSKEYNPFLLYSELTSAAKDLGQTYRDEGGFSPLLGIKVVSRASKIVGVNPELWANTYLGIEDMVRTGLVSADKVDNMIDFMLLLQTPNSLRPKVAKQLFDFDSDAFAKMSDQEKYEYFEKYAQTVARAMKYVDEDATMRKFIPGVKVLTEDKKKKLWGELWKEVVPQEYQDAIKGSSAELKEQLKTFDNLSQFEDAFNKEKDPARRKQIADAYKKAVEKEDAGPTDPTRKLIDDYFGTPKKKKSEDATQKEIYLTKITAEQYKMELNIKETMDKLKEDYVDRLKELEADGDETGDYSKADEFEGAHEAELQCYDEANDMVKEMNALKKDLKEATPEEEKSILTSLDALRKQLVNKFKSVSR